MHKLYQVALSPRTEPMFRTGKWLYKKAFQTHYGENVGTFVEVFNPTRHGTAQYIWDLTPMSLEQVKHPPDLPDNFPCCGLLLKPKEQDLLKRHEKCTTRAVQEGVGKMFLSQAVWFSFQPHPTPKSRFICNIIPCR